MWQESRIHSHAFGFRKKKGATDVVALIRSWWGYTKSSTKSTHSKSEKFVPLLLTVRAILAISKPLRRPSTVPACTRSTRTRKGAHQVSGTFVTPAFTPATQRPLFAPAGSLTRNGA